MTPKILTEEEQRELSKEVIDRWEKRLTVGGSIDYESALNLVFTLRAREQDNDKLREMFASSVCSRDALKQEVAAIHLALTQNQLKMAELMGERDEARKAIGDTAYVYDDDRRSWICSYCGMNVKMVDGAFRTFIHPVPSDCIVLRCGEKQSQDSAH